MVVIHQGVYMGLQNHYIVRPGSFELMADVFSTSGNFVSPNDNSYLIRKAWGSYITHHWSVPYKGGPLIDNWTDQNKTGIQFPASLDPIRSGQELITPDFDRLRDENYAKIFDQLRGSSEILVDLAESPQAIKMIRGALQLKRNIAKFLKEVATKPKKARRVATKVAGKWLEYRYGWLPLINSIYEAGENLREKVQLSTIRVKARSSYTEKRRDRATSGVNGSDSYEEWSIHTELTVRHEYGFRFKPPSPSTQQALNWTSLNPLTIAWELVPFSFVVDWFVNVGDQLRSWENYAVFANLFQGGYETRVTRELRAGRHHNGIYTPVLDYWPDGETKAMYYGSRGDASITGLFCRKTRVKLSSLPTPVGFMVRNNLNSKKVVDAAALTSKWWKRLL